MPEDKHKILKHATGSKSFKIPPIDVDIECQLKKHDTCANNLNKAWSITKNTHEPTGYTINSVNEYQNNYHTYYRGADCMTKLLQDLLKIGKQILNEEKKDIPLTDDEKTKQQQSKYCYLCHYCFNTDKVNITKTAKKLGIIVIIRENIGVLHILYAI